MKTKAWIILGLSISLSPMALAERHQSSLSNSGSRAITSESSPTARAMVLNLPSRAALSNTASAGTTVGTPSTGSLGVRPAVTIDIPYNAPVDLGNLSVGAGGGGDVALAIAGAIGTFGETPAVFGGFGTPVDFAGLKVETPEPPDGGDEGGEGGESGSGAGGGGAGAGGAGAGEQAGQNNNGQNNNGQNNNGQNNNGQNNNGQNNNGQNNNGQNNNGQNNNGGNNNGGNNNGGNNNGGNNNGGNNNGGNNNGGNNNGGNNNGGNNNGGNTRGPAANNSVNSTVSTPASITSNQRNTTGLSGLSERVTALARIENPTPQQTAALRSGLAVLSGELAKPGVDATLSASLTADLALIQGDLEAQGIGLDGKDLPPETDADAGDTGDTGDTGDPGK